MTFSWPDERVPGRFQKQVRKHLLHAGYRLQPDKGWRVWQIKTRPQVTGIVLGEMDGYIRPTGWCGRDAGCIGAVTGRHAPGCTTTRGISRR